MKERDAWGLFQEIVQQDLPKLQENLIVDLGGKYRVFGCYYISISEIGYCVVKEQTEIAIFNELRTALSWCIADKYRQQKLADTILDLDQRKQLAKTDYRVRLRLYEQMSIEQKDFVIRKIEKRREKLVSLDNELARCIGLAKYWQIRGFNNETERIGRPASNRKNR